MRNRPRPKRRNKPGQWLARAFGTIGYYLLSTDMLEQAEHQQQEANIQLQGLVLALMHTYHSRLASRAHRLQYLQQLVTVFRRHGKNTTPKELQDILRAEQEDYLKRMELPAGIALNEALRENVFTALVCILNKIPLFLVRAYCVICCLSDRRAAVHLQLNGSASAVTADCTHQQIPPNW